MLSPAAGRTAWSPLVSLYCPATRGRDSEKVGAAASVSTRYTFVGLADQVAIEEQKDTSGTWKVSKSYAYGAGGENLSLVDTPVNGTTSKKMFYGTNPHGDTETLTGASSGTTTSTYRYTAYGQADKTGTTGDDAIFDNDPAKNADIVNPTASTANASTEPAAPTTWGSANTTQASTGSSPATCSRAP